MHYGMGEDKAKYYFDLNLCTTTDFRSDHGF